ncbi:MAG: GGDEF domain-containing protein [Hyphomicrobiales bacterium]|nr:GGDEF domain-containing protein [Hyphomicrobiales bacterium]
MFGSMQALDVQTLVLVSSLILGALGVLFLINWRDDRSRVELADWGVGFLLVVPGVVLIGRRGEISDLWSIWAANAFVLTAYGMILSGAMRFVDRRPAPGVALAGAAVWSLLCLWPTFFERFDLRVIAVSAICFVQIGLVAHLLWERRRIEPLPSLGRSAVGAAIVAGLQGARGLFMAIAPSELSGSEALRQSHLPWMSLALLVISLFAAHMMLSMSAERAEQRHRRRADSDDLTGLLSRRAFVERATARLAAAPDRGALMFFDIDRFKSINDTHGHAVGDAVLVAFARLVETRLAPDDLFARWGGEEFVLFAVDHDFVAGRRLAEEIRRDFAELDFGLGAALGATVSVGLAAPALIGSDLDRLVASADAGVYAAKRAGRDRVEAVTPDERRAARA